MLNENGKSSVTVNKVELLKKVRANRELHHQQFVEAEKTFRKSVIKKLRRMASEASAGKPVRLSVELSAPFEMTKDYDRVIAMLEMSVSNEVTISEQQFGQYVLDDWSWKNSFLANTQLYNGQRE